MRIGKNDLVLEVGSGHNPHPRADVLADLFEDDKGGHRSGTRAVKDRPFVKADVCRMPFKNKAFDYVVAIHLLEHIPDVEKALKEITRVGKRGFIEVPTEIYEYMHPTPQHLWLCSLEGNTLVFKRKPRGWKSPFGGLFHRMWNDRDYYWFFQHHLHMFHLPLEWEGKIKYRIEKYSPLDMESWDLEKITRRTHRGFREFVPDWLQRRIGKSELYPRAKGLVTRHMRRRKVDLDSLIK